MRRAAERRCARHVGRDERGAGEDGEGLPGLAGGRPCGDGGGREVALRSADHGEQASSDEIGTGQAARGDQPGEERCDECHEREERAVA